TPCAGYGRRPPISGARLEEILQQLRSFEGQKTLGVELDAMQRPVAVPHAHDLPLVGPGTDHEVGIGEGFPANYQRMVTRCLKRIGQAAENALTVVVDRRRLAVHDADVANHLAAENVPDTLMSQADAQHWHRGREATQHVVGDTCLTRRT